MLPFSVDLIIMLKGFMVFFKSLLKSGWLHALFIGFIAYPTGVVIQKFVASYTDSNILVYTFFLVFNSSIALLLMAGRGPLVNETIKRPETWFYGVTQITTIFVSTLLMSYVTATEGVALGLMTGIITLTLSAMFLHQNICKLEALGALIIISGFIIIINNTGLPAELNVLVILLVLLKGLSQGCQKIITEIHKTSRKAITFKEQIRVTGFIMVVASFVFLAFLLSMATIKQYYNFEILRSFPNFSDFLDLRLYLLSAVLGFFFLSVSKYCEFYAGKTIGARYLTSISSVHVVIVFLVERLVSKLGLLDVPQISNLTIFAVGIILVGNFIIALSGLIKGLKTIKSTQNIKL